MNIYRQTTPKLSFPNEGKSQSDTCIYTGNCIPRSFSKDGILASYSAGLQASSSKRTYSMGWLTKLIKHKTDETYFVPISRHANPCDIDGQKEAVLKECVATESGELQSQVLSKGSSPTTPADNVYYTMKLKIHRLSDYATSWQELAKSPSNTSIVNKSKKRKADELGQDLDIQTKRLRESVDDNNNLSQLVDDNNNNLEDNELDAEVAMFMENSGPPTIREIVPVMEPAYTGYQAESPSPWLRCIEGCYHSYRSPLGITRDPREGAIKILDPWPCLYRNTKFGELKKVGELDVERAPNHWRKRSEN